MAMKPKAAKPREDFESFREKLLMLSLQDAPEPSPETKAAPAETAKSVKLYYTKKSENSDKIYFLDLVKDPKFKDAYFVNFKYGKRNGAHKEGTKTKIAVTYVEALNIFNYFMKEKKDEGYTENISGVPFSS